MPPETTAIKLPGAQREAFNALQRGPLYRNRAGNGFAGKGTRTFSLRTIASLQLKELARWRPDEGPFGAVFAINHEAREKWRATLAEFRANKRPLSTTEIVQLIDAMESAPKVLA